MDKMEPGIIASLMGLWQGRGKYSQELAPPKPKDKTNKPKNATRNQ